MGKKDVGCGWETIGGVEVRRDVESDPPLASSRKEKKGELFVA